MGKGAVCPCGLAAKCGMQPRTGQAKQIGYLQIQIHMVIFFGFVLGMNSVSYVG